MARYARAELADYLAAMRDDEETSAGEDSGGDSDLFFEALGRAEAGPVSLALDSDPSPSTAPWPGGVRGFAEWLGILKPMFLSLIGRFIMRYGSMLLN